MKRQSKKKLFFILSGLLTVGVFFIAGFHVGQSRKQCEVCPPQEIDFSLFWETYSVLKEQYVDSAAIEKEKVLYGAIKGMVEEIGDPYTVFMEPSKTKRFLEDISGKFEGVGIEIGIRDDNLQVIAPLEGTPAQEAGLRPGDKIVAVDGDSTADFTLEDAVTKIRGPKGTEVVLTIVRSSWEQEKEISIKRGVIKVPSLRWEILNREGENDEEGSIAYVKLYNFTEKMGIDFARAAVQIFSSPADRIILDLRNNPGGYLEMAQNLAGYFLERGEVVVIEDKGGKEEEFKSQGESLFLDYPVVVLINEGSASASEILAGALRDRRGATLVGQTSFGKGSVQILENLRKGSSLKITIARWLTPAGETIEGSGLEPDVKVELTEEDYVAGEDPQLQKAVEIISNL